MRDLTEKRKQKKFLIISGLAVIFVMGLRYPEYENVYDLKVYYTYYDHLISTPWNEIFEVSRFEPGYAILNKALATLVPWAQFILIAEAVISVYCVCRFIYKNSEYPFQAMIFYITLGTMVFQLTGFRQAFAMSLCLFGVEYIKRRKVIRFVLIVLLAISIHKSAMVFLPFYFIANRKPTLINNIASIFLIFVTVNLADQITTFGNKMLDTNYSGYRGNPLGGLIPIIIYVITIVLSIIYSRKIKNPIPYNMVILGLTIYLMRYTTLALERISFYFTSAVIVQLSNVINFEPDKKTRAYLNFFAVILAIALFMYRLKDSDFAAYRFFWQ